MHTYKITYKDSFTRGNYSETTYTSPEPVSRKFLIDFFGLENDDVEDFTIEEV